MAADILKAHQSIQRLRAWVNAIQAPDTATGIPSFPTTADVADLCDTFEWLYESRADLIRAMDLMRAYAATPVPGSPVVTSDSAGITLVKVEQHEEPSSGG